MSRKAGIPRAFKLSPLLSKLVHGNEGEADELSILRNSGKINRSKKFRHNRLNLPQHTRMCIATGGFERRYHMTYDAFTQLVDILDIKVDFKQSSNSTSGNDPITPTMIVAIGLRFFGGEKIKSLADIFGMGISSAQRVIDVFLEAVELSNHEFLSTDLLPDTVEDRKKMADDWNERSSAFGLYYGCLAAIDRWLCTTEQPSDVDNPADFFSGHYQKFGLNVQAMCDANLHIIYISVAGSGGTNYT